MVMGVSFEVDLASDRQRRRAGPVGLVHANRDDEAGECGERGNGPDRGVEPEARRR